MPEPTTIKIEMDEMKKNAEEVAELLRVMAHPERLMVLCH
ncbi:transcriptional regulator, ArsR family [Vibrio cholerae NCTC 8457]|nr:transcriptional regulator, ArsR family [Vibrio cholerae NCTC 8457]